jgi:hypothetical protein
MTTPWKEWKANNLAKQEAGIVTPMALLNPDTPMADESIKKERYALCEECPHFLATKQCSKCGCFMPAKTGLLHATCPISKW